MLKLLSSAIRYLCLRSMRDEPIEVWKNKIQWYLENRHLKDLNCIDGEPMEFDWKIFQ